MLRAGPRAGAAGLLVVLASGLLIAGSCWPVVAAAADAADAGSSPAAADVANLTTDSFADVVERSTSPALVKFVIPDCPGCAALAADFKKVASNLQGIAPVASVDCTSPAATRTCRSFAAHAFPKVLVFKPGSRVNPYTGGAMKDFSPHEGPLSAKALLSAVTDSLDDSQISRLTSSSAAQAFLTADPKLAKVLLFTDKATSTVLYKGLSWAYARRLACAEVRPSDDAGASLAAEHGVTAYPTLLVIKPDGSKQVYEGALKAPQLREFLDGFAAEEALPADGAASGGGPQRPADPALTGEVVVEPLSAANLTDIDGQAEMWLIAFYAAPGDDSCSEQLEQLGKLVREVQGIVRYGSANTTGMDEEQLAGYEVDVAALTSSPCALQLVLLPHGPGKLAKGEAARWGGGGLSDAKALQAWILQAIPDFTSGLASEVEAQAFLDATAGDLALRPAGEGREERDAPVGKVLLFTDKAEVPGVYKALAAHFAGRSRLLFAWTRASMSAGPGVALMQKMNVRKAPAMTILFPLPAKPLGEADEVPNSPRDNMALQQYMGPLKFQKMLSWLTAMSTLTGMAYKTHAGATKGPEPQDFEIRGHPQLQSACYDKPGLCLITLLDGHSEQANKHRDTVKRAASSLAGQPVNWVVVDVARQPSFRRAYGFTADQLPAMVALSTRRMRFAQGAAPFSEDTIKQLVTKVLTGTAVTLPLPELPALMDGGEAEEEAVQAVEEEFNLDEIMAEEVTELLSNEERLQQAEEAVKREAAAKKQAKSKKGGKKKSKKKKSSKKQQEGAKDEL